MKKIVLITAVLAALAVAGCRQEVPYQPMKLGAPVENAR